MSGKMKILPDNSLRVELSEGAPVNLQATLNRLTAIKAAEAKRMQSGELAAGGNTPFSSFSNYTSFSRGTF